MTPERKEGKDLLPVDPYSRREKKSKDLDPSRRRKAISGEQHRELLHEQKKDSKRKAQPFGGLRSSSPGGGGLSLINS